MTISTGKFVITNFTLKYVMSKEINNNTHRKHPVGIETATLFCKSCEHLWTANEYGDGRLKNCIGNIILTCPKCNANETVARDIFLTA